MNKIALLILAVGLGLCAAALTGFFEWYRATAHLSVWQQLAAFVQSPWLALLVLSAIWLERLLWNWRLSRQPERLRRYQALPKRRKDVARYLEGLLAAAPTAFALVLLFDLTLVIAAVIALPVFGSAMWWLASHIASEKMVGGQSSVEQV